MTKTRQLTASEIAVSEKLRSIIEASERLQIADPRLGAIIASDYGIALCRSVVLSMFNAGIKEYRDPQLRDLQRQRLVDIIEETFLAELNKFDRILSRAEGPRE